MATDLDLHVYDALVGAVERQVDRGRADLQFFLILNASIVAGALAALQFAQRAEAVFIVLLGFAGGFGLSMAGLSVARNNKRYYRALVVKRVLHERGLGLLAQAPGLPSAEHANLSASPLATRAKLEEILADPDAYVSPRIRAGSSTDWGQWALRGFAVLHVTAAVVLANGLMECAFRGLPCTPAG